jgi:hypothetical protein
MKPNKKLSRPSARKAHAKSKAQGSALTQKSSTASSSSAMPPVFCVTGATPDVSAAVFDVLVKAGVAPAVASTGRTSVDIDAWHSQVLAQLPQDWDEGRDERRGDFSYGADAIGESGGVRDGSALSVNGSSLGRFWDQMAGDIFVANFQARAGNATTLAQPWGWANADSVELLSYWASFHPQIRFVLTVTTPQQVLESLLDGDDDRDLQGEVDLPGEPKGLSSELADELLDALRVWQWRTERALRFYHRHGDRTQLLFAHEALAHPQTLVQWLSRQWGVSLSGVDQEMPRDQQAMAPRAAEVSVLAQVAGLQAQRDRVVSQVLSMLPEVMSLHHELLATIAPLVTQLPVQDGSSDFVGQDSVDVGHDNPDNSLLAQANADADGGVSAVIDLPILSLDEDEQLPEAVVQSMCQYRAKLAAVRQIEKDTRTTITTLNGQVEQQKAVLESKQQALEAQTAQTKQAKDVVETLQKQQKALTDQLAAATKAAEAEQKTAASKLKDTEEENELLLAQLHQVQEELEKYFLKAQESDTKTAELQKQTDADKAELAKLAKQKTDADAKIADLQKKQQTIEAASKKVAADLEQAKKAHEVTTKQLKDAQAKLQQADKKHKDAVAKLELEVKEAKAAKDLQARLKDTEEENDLLLAQLHQVQEELERYFLKAQELEQISEEEQSRWHNLIQRLANRYSGLCDYKRIELVESESTADTHVWQIDDYIDAAGREMPQLKFEVLTQDGFVGFAFNRDSEASTQADPQNNITGQNNALLFWPVMAETGNKAETSMPERFELVPGKTEKVLTQFAANLDALSASDWAFLKTLTDLMIEQYQQLVDEEEALEYEEVGAEGISDEWTGDEEIEDDGIGYEGLGDEGIEGEGVGDEGISDEGISDEGIEDEGIDDEEDTESSSLVSNPDLWLKGLQQFATLLEKLPPVLRFDSVSVTSSAEEGDYAHLVLSLSNVVTERGAFPEFQFRVATVSSGEVFDANPRLEFPRRTGEDVFEHWFVESSNAFGENLEIRFAKQDSLVDLPLITARLKDADRQLVAQLIERLPAVMLKIKHHANQVKDQNAVNAEDAHTHQAQSGGQTNKRLNEPVTLAPAVGSLSEKDLDNWLQVSNTMRSIWRAQVRF